MNMDKDAMQGNDPGTGDKAGNHGMLLFGDETPFLSHLPMFMSPHNYQAIFEVSLTGTGTDPLTAYRSDRRQSRTEMYSLVPDVDFVLTDLAGPDAAHPRREAFPGTIWRGHFEPGHFVPKGRPILDGVTVHVTHVIYFQKLNPSESPPDQLEGILVGKGQEVYLVHRITGPPDYDQVLRVNQLEPALQEGDLRQAVPVHISGRSNAIEDRLPAAAPQRFSAQIQSVGRSGPSTREISFAPGEQLYFETNDLAP